MQWNPTFAFPTASTALVAPGAMSAVCMLPSSSMMWCVMLSVFLKTTPWPDATMAGFGLKEFPPILPRIDTVTLPAPVLDAGLAFVGVVGALLLPPPQLASARTAASRPSFRSFSLPVLRRKYFRSEDGATRIPRRIPVNGWIF